MLDRHDVEEVSSMIKPSSMSMVERLIVQPRLALIQLSESMVRQKHGDINCSLPATILKILSCRLQTSLGFVFLYLEQERKMTIMGK